MKLKVKLIILIIAYSYVIRTANTKLKLVFSRGILTYANKSLADMEIKMIHLNRTCSALNVKLHTYKSVTKGAKVNMKAYFVRNNIPLFSGIQFDVPFCESLSSNAFGVRDMVANLTNRKLCPLKPGWYIGNIRFEHVDLPVGTPIANYMMNVTLILKGAIVYSTSFWFEIIKELE